MARFRPAGFDDVIVLAAGGGVDRRRCDLAGRWRRDERLCRAWRVGTMATFEASDIYLRDVRYIGQSGSKIDDMRLMLFQAETGTLSPNRSVAAIGSLAAAWNGIKAVKEQTFPGKIVIYPNIADLPLTPLAELEEKLPTVYAKLKDGREWTNEAEAELLRLMLE